MSGSGDLTGLLNRRSFFDSCEALHKFCMRNKQNYSILSIDLDHFKKINDKFGHAAGDAVLRSFGITSQHLSRDSDILSRLGGEEFVFFLPNTNIKQAIFFAERLNKKIQTTDVIFENNHIEYTISTGIAINNCSDETPLEDIFINSDKALYSAKNSGRNQIVVYENPI